MPSVDLRLLPDAIVLDFGALLAICQLQQKESAICALTRMCADQEKQQNVHSRYTYRCAYTITLAGLSARAGG